MVSKVLPEEGEQKDTARHDEVQRPRRFAQLLYPVFLPEPDGGIAVRASPPSIHPPKQDGEPHLLNVSRPKRSTRVVRMMWNILENPESGPVARVLARVARPFILFTVCVTLLQTMIAPRLFSGVFAAVVESIIDCIFALEFLVRLFCCPRLAVFFLSFHNVIDFLAAASLAFRAAAGFVLPDSEEERDNFVCLVLLCAVPIIRLLKTLRRFEKFHLLLRAFWLAAEALPVLLYILCTIALVFSMLIYVAEPRWNIKTTGHSLWFTIVTMSTVGYGDTTPKSHAGSVVTGGLICVTVLYMAVPVGIIGNAFNDTWRDRDRILLVKKTRDRLEQWGYSAQDIPALFRATDPDHTGHLEMSQFRDLITRMQIGFSEERILRLFEAFDHDKNGSVDDREFVRGLFPQAYHEIYHERQDEWGPEEDQAPQWPSQDSGLEGETSK